MLARRKPEHHHRHHHGIVCAQKSLENDEHADGGQISPLEHPEIIPGID